jgi:hypothetical protein
MAISWAAALRLYGKQKGAFVVPKKGSADYEAIKKLQMETEDGPEHAVKKRQSKKASGATSDMLPGITSGKVSKKKAPTGAGGASEVTTRKGDPVLPPAVDTKIIDPQDKEGQKKTRVKNAAKVPEAKKSGVQSSGVTKKEEATDFIENKNTGMSAVVTAQTSEQKKELQKALKQAKATPKIVTVREGTDETIENMKTDDAPAIEARAPFSIQSLRNRLLC